MLPERFWISKKNVIYKEKIRLKRKIWNYYNSKVTSFCTFGIGNALLLCK